MWEVDPSIFEQGRKASFFEQRILPPLRQVGKFSLYSLAIVYPIGLVYVGLAYGGAAFWSFFAGSIIIMGVVITKLGYASNFSHWDMGIKRMMGVVLGFGITVGFYAGLLYSRTLFVPTAFAVIGLGAFFLWKRFKS